MPPPVRGMSRRIGGEGRSKVGPCKVACWRSEGCEVGIPDGGGIAVAEAGGAGSRVRFTDAGDGAPKLVLVLLIPAGNACIGQCHINEGQEARKLHDIGLHLLGNLHRDLVVHPRRRSETGGSVIGPVDTCYCLVFRSFRRRDYAVAAETLYFIESCRVVPACKRGRTRNREQALEDNKRGHLSLLCPNARGEQLIGSWRHFPG